MSLTATDTKTLQYLLKMSKPANDPPVTLAGLTALFEFIKSTDDRKVVQRMLEEGLDDVLISCLDTWRPNGNNLDVHNVLVMVTMELAHHLSSIPNMIPQQMMTHKFYTSLLHLVNTKGEFFRFSDEFQKTFCLLTRRKQLIADVVKETVDGDVKERLGNVLKYPVEHPGYIYRCSCFDTSEDTDVNITQQLINEGLAWPNTDTREGEPQNWKDVVVTEYIWDQYFFALLGEAAIRQAATIKSIIEDEKGDLKAASIEVGKIVLVLRDGQQEYVRGQVVSHVGGWVKLMMLDYGGVREVQLQDVFELPSSLSLMYFPAQVSLCYLAGVCAPPCDVDTMQLALASMCNLIRYCVRSGLTLLKTDCCLTYLLQVLHCPDSTMVLQTLRILNNLASNPRTDQTVFEPVLLDLLELLKSLPDRSWSINLREDMSYACMSCIANILSFSRHYRSLFYQNEGLRTVLHILVGHKPLKPIYRMGTQLLRNFLYVPEVKVTQQWPSDDVPNADMLSAGSSRLNQSKNPQLPDSRSEDVSSSEEEGDTRENPSASDHLSLTRGAGLEVTDGDVVAINSGEMQTSPDRHYIYGSQVDFDNDLTHEILPNKKLSKVSKTVVAEVTCGMLNSRGGTIYFGVSEDRFVRGMKISRDDRDCFRLGVDKMIMDWISPPVLYIQLELVYTPVFMTTYRPPPDDYIQVSDLYIVEIKVSPNRGALHSVRDKCFYRFGSQTLPLTTKEVRELVVMAEENAYKDEILSWRQKLKNLKDKRLTS